MPFPLRQRLARPSIVRAAAVYLPAIAVAGIVTAVAAHSVTSAVLRQLAPRAHAPQGVRVAGLTVQPDGAASAVAASLPAIRREAAMTPLQERWFDGWSRPRSRYDPRRAPSPFGSSARGPLRPPGLFDRSFGDDDEDDRPTVGSTLRTVCVRLCDGYYFPISFSVTRDRLEHDSQVCESRCGAQARLFVHANPGGSTEDLQDLQGRPYRQLRTAFLYRAEYVPSCKCQPHPWETEALDRHRIYALAVGVKKGNKDAAKELQALQAKAKLAAPAAGKQRQRQPALADAGPAQRHQAAPFVVGREGERVMRLGVDGTPKGKAATSPDRSRARQESDWRRRSVDPRY